MFECTVNHHVRIKIEDFLQYSWTREMMDYLEIKSWLYNEKKKMFLVRKMGAHIFLEVGVYSLKTLKRVFEEYLICLNPEIILCLHFFFIFPLFYFLKSMK